MEYLFKGIIIGLAIAAPVGPIGLLCVRRTLAHGRLSGLLSGLGAASADGFYGVIAGFGITAISSLLLKEQMLLSLAGGLFLCYLSYKTFFSRPADHSAKAPHKGLISDYLSTFFLTITNPVTILSFLAIFAGVGIEGENYASSMLLVFGVFLGSALWWILLSMGISFVRGKINIMVMYWINKGSGVTIFAFGVAALLSLLK
jgi:threonine/homoserine/homoserine lactone efflux protein